MLGELAQDLGKPRFGVCMACRHLGGDGCCLQGQLLYECTFLDEPLAERELSSFV